jgi:ADP-ribosylglycohydrolase
MLGAIVGDILGSAYEGIPVKSKRFAAFVRGSRFTDDTVLTCAVALSLLRGRPYADTLRELGMRYPDAGYGGSFRRWMMEGIVMDGGSYGNGSAMRASPVGWAFDSAEEVLREAKASALPTHGHPEGIKGAQAAALGVFLARKGASKEDIRRELSGRFGYDLSRSVDGIRPSYSFEVSCQLSVPEAIIAFLDSTDCEDAMRNAVSLGGDTDTQAAIAGAIAEAFYGGVPESLAVPALARLDSALYDIAAEAYGRWRPAEAPRLAAMRAKALARALAEPESQEEEPEELVEVETQDAQEAWGRCREDMVANGAWYEALGAFKGSSLGPAAPVYVKVEGPKLLALGRSDFYLSFIEDLKGALGSRYYQSDYMAWIDPADPYASLEYYIKTAERIEFSLEGIEPAELRRATSGSGGPKPNRGELGTRFMTSWEMNRVFWGPELARTRWHLRGGMRKEEAFEALGPRVARDAIEEAPC